MTTRKVRERQRERYWRREHAAGRCWPDYRSRVDLHHLRDRAIDLLQRDPATWDDLDRYIVEAYGPADAVTVSADDA